MKSYYRLNHTRHIWSADIESPEKWEVNFIQIGCLPSTAEALEMGIAFVAWLQNQELVNLPVAEFSTIRQTSGMSGRRDFYSFVPGKTWYDVIPGTDIIREAVGKAKSVHLLHDSCEDTPNVGMTFSYDNFADLLFVYIQYFSYDRTMEDIDKLATGVATEAMQSLREYLPHCNFPAVNCAQDGHFSFMFIPVEDKGEMVEVEGLGMVKMSPDKSFCMFEEQRINAPFPQRIGVGCQYILWYAEEKKIIWKGQEIQVDGSAISFIDEYSKMIISNFITVTASLRQIGVEITSDFENGGTGTFKFTSIPPVVKGEVNEEVERQAIIDNL